MTTAHAGAVRRRREPPPGLPTVLTAVVLLVVGTLLASLRLTWLEQQTLWAEDGRDFVSDALARPSITTLFAPFGGYQQFLPRVLAWVATSVTGPEHLAPVVTLLACATVGSVSALLFLYSRSVLTSPVLRVLLALVPPLIPTAPREALGTLDNLHTFLLLLAPWAFAFVPRSWWTSAATAVVALVVLLSEAQAVLLLPLLLIGVRSSRKWPVVAAAVLGAVVEVVTIVTAPRLHVDYGPAHITLADAALGFVTAAVPAAWTWDLTSVAHVIAAAGTLPFLAAAAVGIALAAAGAVVGRWSHRWLIVATVLMAGAVWTGAILITPAPAFAFTHDTAQHVAGFGVWRYTTAASGFLLVALVVVADALVTGRGRTRRVLALVVALTVAVPLVVDVHTPPSSRDGGPALVTQVEPARVTCRSGGSRTVAVRQQPATWVTTLPCAYVTR